MTILSDEYEHGVLDFNIRHEEHFQIYLEKSNKIMIHEFISLVYTGILVHWNIAISYLIFYNILYYHLTLHKL